ncbi:MAG: allantoate amidohydrolase [Terracidiphilus sp.]
MRDRAQRAITECQLIAGFTEEPGRTTRRFLTPPVHLVHAHLRKRMEAMGMAVHVDAAGNLRGLWQPRGAHANPAATGKRLLLGSHIDTVPNAGAYDGVLGVVLALEWTQLAQELAYPLPIEVIAFSEEEGVRYGVPFLGSRAVAGSFDAALLTLKDADGIAMEEAIRAFGLDPVSVPAAAADAENVLGFVEIHIEQGPALEAENAALAVVEGIAGQSRMEFEFAGQANHAGTTPMHLRRDALAAAVEWMTEVEIMARSVDGLVATVGKMRVEPNAANVIPGSVTVSLDARHKSDDTRAQAVRDLTAKAAEIAARRGIGLDYMERMNQPGVRMDDELTDRLLRAIEAAGFVKKTMHSGAGHDAMVMAACVPATMLFLRSPGGISHHPDESVREEDVEAALLVGRKFLEQLAADVR